MRCCSTVLLTFKRIKKCDIDKQNNFIVYVVYNLKSVNRSMSFLSAASYERGYEKLFHCNLIY